MLHDQLDLYDALLPLRAPHLALYRDLAARRRGGRQFLAPLAASGRDAISIDLAPAMRTRARCTPTSGRFETAFIARNSPLHPRSR